MLGITIDWFAAYAVTLGFFAGDGTFLERSRNVGGTVLLVTVVAAITFDENGRAPNERLSNTVLVKR